MNDDLSQVLVKLEEMRGDMKVVRKEVCYIKRGVEDRAARLEKLEDEQRATDRKINWMSGVVATFAAAAAFVSRFWEPPAQ
jgi:NADH:ubiquinone oxidoreductase subunit D